MRTTPAVLVFDVNETLSDMTPMKNAFTESGLHETLSRVWFAELLRDGFALTTTGENPAFLDIASDSLHRLLTQTLGPGNYQNQTNHIMGVFKNLPLHPDVAPGIRKLNTITQLVTLSNGSPSVAESLTSRGGIRDKFSRLLSVQDAPCWKPAAEAYRYVSRQTGHTPGDLMLVAVHPWDIHGAKTAGLQTAWINRSATAYPSYYAQPDVEAQDLIELARTLQTT